jgi:phage shock protein A
MSILDRVRRIAQSNLEHLLDRADTPEMEIQDKIRELEEAVSEAKDALASFAVTHKTRQRENERLARQQSEWQEKAEDALRSGNEQSARHALGERIKIEERLQATTPALEESARSYAELKDNLVVLHDQINAARRKLRELQARKRAAEAQKAFGSKLDKVEGAAAAGAMDKFEGDVFHAEAAAEVDREIRSETSSTDARIRKQAHEAKIEAELAALKEQAGNRD